MRSDTEEDIRLHCGRYVLSLRYPLIMGIVNLTDDSFSGDGLHGDTQRAIEQGLRMVEEGAHILDIGGIHIERRDTGILYRVKNA